MKATITHIGVYTPDLERLRRFYETYFEAVSNEKYEESDGFSSYFLTLGGETRLELMSHTQLEARAVLEKVNGLSHLAISVGSREAVTELTARLAQDGYTIFRQPRDTGDGYFESSVSDPDGNPIEITI